MANTTEIVFHELQSFQASVEELGGFQEAVIECIGQDPNERDLYKCSLNTQSATLQNTIYFEVERPSTVYVKTRVGILLFTLMGAVAHYRYLELMHHDEVIGSMDTNDVYDVTQRRIIRGKDCEGSEMYEMEHVQTECKLAEIKPLSPTKVSVEILNPNISKTGRALVLSKAFKSAVTKYKLNKNLQDITPIQYPR